MIDRIFIRTAVFPLLITSLFGEIASHHKPDPHGTRGERWEQERRRLAETPLSSRFEEARSGSGGSEPPEPNPSENEEDILRRERRIRRPSAVNAQNLASAAIG